MTWRPPRFTHEQRLAEAQAIIQSLQRRYGDHLVAAMLEGSVSKGMDVACSDLELGVVVRGTEDRWYPFTRCGMFIGISYRSPESEMADAAKVDYTWPVASDSLSYGTVLYDPSGFYAKLRAIRSGAEASAGFRPLIRDALADMYENVLKLFALESGQGLEAVMYAGQAGYWAAMAVALANKHRYLSTRRIFEESFTLEVLPARYRENLEALLSAGTDVLGAQGAVGRLWEATLEWAPSLGVRLDDEGAML